MRPLAPPGTGPRSRVVEVLVCLLVGAAVVGAVPAIAVVPVAASASTSVRDDMARTLRGGWGSAVVGGAYQLSRAWAGSVRPGAATLTAAPGRSGSAVLPAVAVRDVRVRTAISLERLPAESGGIYASVLLRRLPDRDSYRAKLRVLPDGEVRLSFSRVRSGVETLIGGERRAVAVLAPGVRLTLETSAVGDSAVVLGSRVWSGDAVPATGWQHTVVDGSAERISRPGAVGLHVYQSGTSRVPAVVAFHGLAADPAPAPGAAPPSPAPSGAVAVPEADGPERPPAGSAPLGSTSYPVPSDAVVVSPSGDDTAPGTITAPFRTVGRALAVAPTGGTVVLRAGVYHETVQIPAGRRLTVQSHPGEEVWLDGSTAVRGWTRSGTTWVHEGWTAEFDSTPCYDPGGCATTDADFRFVAPEAPMAAHPDQVWVDGAALRQVGSADEVGTGAFFVDDARDRLVVGSDPAGREVRASDLVEAVTVQGAGSVLRGFGVRRYATPLPRIATVRIDAADVTVENLVVVQNATTGITVVRPGGVLRAVTAAENGMLGIHANQADGLVVEGAAAVRNNLEGFQQAPVAGGVKITRSRDVTVRGGRFADNLGTGVWFDESVHGITLAGNAITGNGGHGVSIELSAAAVVVDNLIGENSRDGLKINNTDGVRVWNNTFTGGARTVWIVQDPRAPGTPGAAGRDPRQQQPDPTVTWTAGRVTLSNNVFAAAAPGSPCVLCVEDTTGARSAEEMAVVTDGNVYARTSASSPARLVVWSTGRGDPRVFADLAAFAAATGQDRASVERDGQRVVSPSGVPVALPDGVARPVPADVAALMGVPTGTRRLGATGPPPPR